MILKDLDPFSSTDTLLCAGRKAEEQMAFYLQRRFADDCHARVFNSLRFVSEDDAAQIDHLVLHPYGMIIIESKSVTTRVTINTENEWIRWIGRTQKGMPSPVLQARRQGDFLRRYLQAHREEMRGKFLLGLRQAGFQKMPLDILVAISDSGVIDRKTSIPEVAKADQIPDRIQLRVKEYRHANHPLNLSVKSSLIYAAFTEEETDRITAFLLKRHTPLVHMEMASAEPAQVPRPPSRPEEQLLSTPVCRHCASAQVSIQSGPYGYYFKCGACAGNTPIREMCDTCKTKARIRKSGEVFYLRCESCGASRLFHSNSLDEPN
jgi:hypothetical protein